MSKFKKRLRKDFTSSMMPEKRINVSNLEPNKKSYKVPASPFKVATRALALVCAAVLLIPIIAFCVIFLDIDDKPKLYNKSYSISDKYNMDKESFKALNEIHYPQNKPKQEIGEEYKKAMLDFTYNLDEKGKDIENFSYSPMNLYSNLHLISLGYKNEAMVSKFNEVLGIESSKRSIEYKKMFENNFIINDEGTTQMYHGTFLSNDYKINDAYIKELTNNYSEAFSMNFKNEKDVDLMLEWINEKLQEKEFVTKQDLGYMNNTIYYLFSALYFSQKWSRTYYASESYDDTFYMAKNENSRVTYMMHQYYDEVYDYDKYFSFYDRYDNGYRIQYLVSKDDNVPIDEAIEGQNIFKENPENKVVIDRGDGYIEENISIDLTVPKMDMREYIDFSEMLEAMGLEDIFKPSVNNLDNVFDTQKERCVQSIAQKNHIVFDEDGTTIVSVTFSGFGSAGSFVGDALKVKLDHPFIYAIYDESGLPIFVGHVDRL